MKSVMFAVAVLLTAAIATGAPQQSPKIDVPTLPTERDQFGGRPGSFHFVTNEQAMADAVQLQLVFAALDRIDARISKLDPAMRDEFSSDMETLRGFALSCHMQRRTAAGATASDVEDRLNEAKGKFMCGACHGRGMIHGGGMQMRGMGPGEQ